MKIPCARSLRVWHWLNRAMKRTMAIIPSAILVFLISIFISACCGSHNDYVSKINYGMPEADILKLVKYEPNHVFIFKDIDDSVFKCDSFFFKDNCITYSFLYRNGILISVVPGDDFRYKLRDVDTTITKGQPIPYQYDYSSLKQLFLPPIPIDQIDFNAVDIKEKEFRSEMHRASALEMTLLSPLIIGLSPVYMPFMIRDGYKVSCVSERINETYKLGLSSEDVKKIRGKPEHVMSDGNDYMIMSFGDYRESPDSNVFYGHYATYGFKHNILVWIRFGTTISSE